MTQLVHETDDTFLGLLESQADPMAIIFDIETGPGYAAVVEPIYEAHKKQNLSLPEPPPPFDATQVKLGNAKTEQAIADTIARRHAAHAADVQGHAHKCHKKEADFRASFMDGAPLSETIGRTLAIGYGVTFQGNDHIFPHISPDGERRLLRTFSAVFHLARKSNSFMVSWNGHKFDLPFLVNRARILKFKFPVLYAGGRLKEPMFIDLKEVWSMGRSVQRTPSLQKVALACHLKGKHNGMSGDEFWKALAASKETDATKYLISDIQTTMDIAKRTKEWAPEVRERVGP